jgi:small subunit ribosomal protein S6
MHFKIEGSGKTIDELEKNEIIDKNLLRYMTVKVKKFDLEKKYFAKKDQIEKKEYKRD